jgi:glycosyltransferase involved in cell wall biosynthesis
MISLPKVVLVGGPDVDARLELMHCLKDDFNIGALGSSPTLHDRFLAEGFDYNTYRLSRGANPLSDLQTGRELAPIFQRLKPHIVHTFDTKPGVWARVAARLAGVPIIIGTLPGLGSLYTSDNLTARLIRFVYQPLQKLACYSSDLTIFQNHDDVRQFVAAGIVSKQKTKVILGSGVSTNLFSPARVSKIEQDQLRRELSLDHNHIVVTMISRVIRSKGVLDFMAAAQNIASRYTNVRFLLIGTPDDESVDRLNSAELTRLKQAVIWPGPRQDIPTVLAASDIFVLPSTYREGIPRVLLEAASTELPIITTNSPGCNEVVENDVNGFLVPVRDPDALSQAILRLIEQPELRQRFGRASRQRAVAHFDLSVIAAQTRSVYHELLARKGCCDKVTGRHSHPLA